LQERTRHDGRLADQALFQFTGLCQDVHAFLFQQLAIDAIDEYRVYDSGLESLALNALIAYRLEQNLIALRIDAKYSSQSMTPIQVPPPTLLMASFFPRKSSGLLIFGRTTTS